MSDLSGFYIALTIISTIAVIWGLISKSNLTYLFAGVVTSFLITLPVYPVWTHFAKTDAETYYEYWNGSETGAESYSKQCYRDGSCIHTYQCDPYLVTEVEYYTDSDGKRQSRLVTVTKFHSCPYSTEETQFTINTTLGPKNAGNWLMTGEEFRWGTPIPGGRVTEPPALWAEAKNRIDAGNPGGVTERHPYRNFILSSDTTIFKNYEGDIEKYKKDNLLGFPANNVTGLYDAVKVYSFGVEIPLMQKYIENTQYLNARVGSELHGDVHIVFVPSDKVKNFEEYRNVLQAYWTSKEAGKNAIAKNTIVIILGVQNNKIQWGTGFTGMPVGNEGLLHQFVTDFKNIPLDENLIGSPRFDIATGKYVSSDGMIENMLFGVNKFERVSMSGVDKNDKGSGFQYLSDAWEPDEGTVIGIYILSTVLALLVLSGAIMLSYKNKYEYDFIQNQTYKMFRKGH